MVPRNVENTNDSNDGNTKNSDNKTVIIAPPDGRSPPYVRCESSEAFVNPLSSTCSAEMNKELNLNLGQRLISPENETLLWTIRFLNSVLVEWWEHLLFKFWNGVPVEWRRRIMLFLWKRFYLPLHKALLGKRTGIHKDASLEYHALTTILWWGRLFPVTVRRMRFSLQQLSTWTTHTIHHERIQRIHVEDYYSNNKDDDQTSRDVKGLFIHNSKDNSEWTIFWLYGGAFLAGDAAGNSAHADAMATKTNMDVFVPSYRLVPEVTMDQVLWDVCLAYHWLCKIRDPSKIILLGISSGAALCVRLMQFIAEAQQRNETLVPQIVTPLVMDVNMPAGAILLGPFVDYAEPPPGGSFQEYPKHDLIVNQRVIESGIPFLDSHIPAGQRRLYSPVHRNCAGLPPLCVIASEHEVVYDMTVQLINRARAANVPVTVGCWKYMCHVFPFFDGFLPEGQQAIKMVVEWVAKLQKQSHSESGEMTNGKKDN